MLTARRLQQLGFDVKNKQNHWWMEKNRFCLFPMNGSWAIGADFGTLAIGVDGYILIIDTESELKSYLAKVGINGIL